MKLAIETKDRRLEVVYEPSKQRVFVAVLAGNELIRELRVMELRDFLHELGITLQDCQEALAEKGE